MKPLSPSVILLALWIIVAGCSRPQVPPGTSTAPADGTFPITVTDDLGRAVTVPARPERIISLSPAATETLFAVGAGPRVIAVTTTDSYPPEAKRLPTVGGFGPSTISTESILAQRPDLIIACGSFHQAIVEMLDSVGLKVVALDASTIEEAQAFFARVGRLTGQSAEAERLTADFARRREAVRQRTRNVSPHKRPKVLYVLWDDPLQTAGPNTFIGQMIADAGGINLFSDTARQYPQISDEAVLSRNPDIILVQDHGGTGMSNRIGKRQGWGQLKAVKAGRIKTVDEDLVNRPGPRLIDGLEAVEAVLRESR